MANTAELKEVTKRPARKVTTKQVIVDTVPVEEKTSEKIVIKDIDQDQYVTVRNGFQGKLIYKSKKTGEVYVWESFGDEQDIELRELKNARNASKSFFTNNWFMFDEDWIVDYLGVKAFYKHAIRIEDFDNIFVKSPNEIKEIIGGMSRGQKKSVAYRAKQLISENEIDSMKAIAAIEEALGIELIER